MNFTIQLPQQQLEQILNVLALRPYNEVAPLIATIQQQAEQQVRAAQEPRTGQSLQAVG